MFQGRKQRLAKLYVPSDASVQTIFHCPYSIQHMLSITGLTAIFICVMFQGRKAVPGQTV